MIRMSFRADTGSHEMDVTLSAGTTRYFAVALRDRGAAPLFGMIGVLVETARADPKNNGSLEMVELTEEQAMPFFEECAHFDPGAGA